MARNLSSNGPAEGHNSGMIDGDALKRYVDRVVSLMADRKALNDDIKEVYEESKEAGFVTKQLRQLVREAMMEPDVLQDHLSQMDALRQALGPFVTTPLAQAAMAAQEPKRGRGRPRKNATLQEVFDKAETHLSGEPDYGNELEPLDAA